MADLNTREFLRETRKKRDEAEAARRTKAEEEEKARRAEKARGKKPATESRKQPAGGAAEVPPTKRSGGVVIRKPSQRDPENKNRKVPAAKGASKKAAEKTSGPKGDPKKVAEKVAAKGDEGAKPAEAKEVGPEGDEEWESLSEGSDSGVRKGPSLEDFKFIRCTPRFNHSLAEKSIMSDRDLARVLAQDSITLHDLNQLKACTLDENLQTVILTSYQTMARAAFSLRKYRDQLSKFRSAEAMIDQAKAFGHEEIEARKVAEEKLRLAEEQVIQLQTDLLKKDLELADSQGKCADLEGQHGLRQLEIATERAKSSELEKSLQEERDRSAELQKSLQARLEAEESIKAEAIQAYLKSPDYLEKLGSQLLEAYDEAFLNCKERVAELFPDLDISKLTPPSLP